MEDPAMERSHTAIPHGPTNDTHAHRQHVSRRCGSVISDLVVPVSLMAATLERFHKYSGGRGNFLAAGSICARYRNGERNAFDYNHNRTPPRPCIIDR